MLGIKRHLVVEFIPHQYQGDTRRRLVGIKRHLVVELVLYIIGNSEDTSPIPRRYKTKTGRNKETSSGRAYTKDQGDFYKQILRV